MRQYLPNSRLLGIHLTISTHSGPQVVFHYPPSDVESIIKEQNRLLDSKQRSETPNPSVSSGKTSSYHGKTPSLSRRAFESPSTAGVASELNSSYYERQENSSSDSSSLSGLSESELSTDYADESSSSSADWSNDAGQQDDGSDAFSNPNESNFNEVTTEKALSAKAETSKVSAAEVLDIFHVNSSARERQVTSQPQMLSVDTTATVNEGDSSEEEPRTGTGYRSEADTLHKMKNRDISINDAYFTDASFRDISKAFGFDREFLAEFCSPERELCNDMFEFTVDNICFLGLPIHVDSEGNWKKTKKKRKHGKYRRTSSTTAKSIHRRSGTSKDSVSGTSFHERDVDTTQHSEKLDEAEASNTEEDMFGESLSMFNVCFVMNPPLTEYNQRIDDMFHHVVARLSLVLRTAQAKSLYVTKECHIIAKETEAVIKSSKKYKSMKSSASQGRYLYERILSKSSLARALTICVDKLQRNEVASFSIDDMKSVLLQIPIHNELRILPNLKMFDVLPGSYVTSILNSKFLGPLSSMSTRSEQHHFDFEEDRDKMNEFEHHENILNYSLLLLDEPDNIINKLNSFSSKDDTSNKILAHLVKHVQPSVPLGAYQYLIADLFNDGVEATEYSSFQTNILRSCALHLLYWRHARVIIPISSKNTYIVSPLAPIKTIPAEYGSSDAESKPLIYQNREKFKERFPSLPSLTSFLSLLSNTIPKPFGSIIPSKEHKIIYLSALEWLLKYGYVTQLLTFVLIRIDKQIKMAVDEDLEKEGFRRKRQDRKSEKDVRDNVAAHEHVGNLANPDTHLNNLGQREYEEDEVHLQYDDPEMEKDYTIILEPERAGAIEKRWIRKCVQDQPPDIQLLFNKVVKYLNGRTPIELVISKEKISRHDIRKLKRAMGNYWVEMHHW